MNGEYDIAYYTTDCRMPSPTCFAYPGMIVSQNGMGQHMSIQGGQSGCMANVGGVKRLLASLLGLRSEHNKPGRDNFITVFPTNVDVRSELFAPLNQYSPTSVLSNPNDFDYNSITLINPFEYSATGQPVIQSRGTPFFTNGAISLKDCQALSYYYSCPATNQCRDRKNDGEYG